MFIILNDNDAMLKTCSLVNGKFCQYIMMAKTSAVKRLIASKKLISIYIIYLCVCINTKQCMYF